MSDEGVNLLRAGLGLVLAPAAFLLPGWLWSRRFHSPAPLLTGFVLSAIVWFHLVLLCSIVGLTEGRPLFLGSWLVFCAVSLLATSKGKRLPEPKAQESLAPHGADWIWITAAGLGLLSLSLRVAIDPLPGWDNSFRWDYIAHTLLERGRLDFYPPVTADDFEHYAWCDGIPPLVPLLNAFVYLVAGAETPGLLAGRVIGEACLIGSAAFRLGQTLWGVRGGWATLGLLGTSSLVLWGIAIGQETGLLALSLITMLWLLEKNQRQSSASTLAWAAIAAGVGGLSREYGLAFGLIGLSVLLARPATRRRAGWFLGIFAATTVSWYLRNWIRTGNPLYPQTLGGLFPGNSVFTEFLGAVHRYWQLNSAHINRLNLTLALLVTGGIAALAGAIGAAKLWRTSWPFMGGIALVAVLWLWSVSQTAGGISYSTRVLVPAVMVAAALGGWLGTASPRVRYGIATLAFLAAADAARRSWFLPTDTLAAPLSLSWQPWRLTRDMIAVGIEGAGWNRVEALAGDGLILVDSPSLHATLTRRGLRAASYFSPAAAPCFDDALTFLEARQRLHSSGVRLVAFLGDDPVSRSFLNAHSFPRALRENYRAKLVGGFSVYDLDALQPLPERRP